jgi:hypothetical protein
LQWHDPEKGAVGFHVGDSDAIWPEFPIDEGQSGGVAATQ